MAKPFRKKKLFSVARKLGITTDHIETFLKENGHGDALKGKGLNSAITEPEAYQALLDRFKSDRATTSRVDKLRKARRERQAETAESSREREPAAPKRVAVTPATKMPTVRRRTVVRRPVPRRPVPAASKPPVPKSPIEKPQEATPKPTAKDARAETPDARAEKATIKAAPAPAPVKPVVPQPPAAKEPAKELAVVPPTPKATPKEVAEARPKADVIKVAPESTPQPQAEKPAAEPPVVQEAPVVREEPTARSEEAAPVVLVATPKPAAEVSEAAAPAPEVTPALQPEVDAPAEDALQAAPEPQSQPDAEQPAVEAPVAEEVPKASEEAPAPAPETTEPAELAEPVAKKRAKPEVSRDEGIAAPQEDGVIKAADRVNLQGITVLGKLDLDSVKDKSPAPAAKPKRRRKRKGTKAAGTAKAGADTARASAAPKRKRGRRRGKPSVQSGDVEKSVQDTLRQVEQRSSRRKQRLRRARRQQREERRKERLAQVAGEQKVRVTEFVSTGELANHMGVSVTDVISKLFTAGMMVSINQRLDADTISFVADEFGYEVEFITEFGTDDIEIEESDPADLVPRAPVVTVMGHVDHGKTSLLDYIRRTNVAIGESGGITQHIGAYKVKLDGGRIVTFLDTPGHEAFTAMRARGAKVTDVVILVVAADDAVMPQTIEAINHARAAEVSVIVAVNKIDLPDANSQRVMQQLSDHGILVEQYGGQVQCAHVSAKSGEGVEDLLEKVLLEADILELKANPERRAQGIVIESRLDRGRGNVATVLVLDGTLRVGDPFVAGIYGGRVRAMFDEKDARIKHARPSEPALVLGLPGQPTVGDQFVGFDDADEAKVVAQRRQQIWREQKMRQYKHVRLEDIGRRMALGDFNELNLIIKADVGGSVEAINDSLLKLSTSEVAVNIIHSGVGAINESDVMLASASDAVIIGFQVRPTNGARNASEREEIDIHTYSIIYDAIEDVRDALEGLLTPEETEKVTAVVDVRDIFKVPKVGTVAGCYIQEGKVRRGDTVRILRESIVIYNGRISSLRRFKDDVREVVSGYECGMGIEGYNDLKVGDQFEIYEIVETKRTLV